MPVVIIKMTIDRNRNVNMAVINVSQTLVTYFFRVIGKA